MARPSREQLPHCFASCSVLRPTRADGCKRMTGAAAIIARDSQPRLRVPKCTFEHTKDGSLPSATKMTVARASELIESRGGCGNRLNESDPNDAHGPSSGAARVSPLDRMPPRLRAGSSGSSCPVSRAPRVRPLRGRRLATKRQCRCGPVINARRDWHESAPREDLSGAVEHLPSDERLRTGTPRQTARGDPAVVLGPVHGEACAPYRRVRPSCRTSNSPPALTLSSQSRPRHRTVPMHEDR
jgi:hypothetical protein